LTGHGAVAMNTKTNKIGDAAWAMPCANLKFCSHASREGVPPQSNCLQIGGRPCQMSGSYGHVTDRRERRTHTHALPHIDTHTHTHPQKTRERERDRKIGRERERDRERGKSGSKKGQPGVTTIQGMGNMQQVHSTDVYTQMSACR